VSARPHSQLSSFGDRKSNSVQVSLAGRFMVSSKSEYPCRIVEMSTDEILISTDVRPELGEMIVVYITELGRFEGSVERHEFVGFRIGMDLTETKHKRLAEQLVWFGNREIFDLPEARLNKRFVPLMQWTVVHLANGKERMAKINDISASGVNIEVSISLLNAILLVGSHVVIGTRAATVVRVILGGFVAKFDEPFPENEIDETIRL
jgi:hypothetical protein